MIRSHLVRRLLGFFGRFVGVSNRVRHPYRNELPGLSREAETRNDPNFGWPGAVSNEGAPRNDEYPVNQAILSEDINVGGNNPTWVAHLNALAIKNDDVFVNQSFVGHSALSLKNDPNVNQHMAGVFGKKAGAS